MKVGRTIRGFGLIEFEDTHRLKCSIQESSAPGKLWVGVDDARPQRMDERRGWVPFPIPGSVLLHTRMHLDKKLAKQLIARLSKWVKDGTLK